MRDIIFLKSLQESIRTWKKDYIEQIGTTNGAVFSETFQKAFRIFSVYQEYTSETGFFSDHQRNNPLLNAMFGAGNTSYGNVFSSDGVLESYAEGAFVSAITDYASGVSGKSSILNGLSLSKTNMASLGSTLVINSLQDSNILSNDIALHLNNLATAGTAIANGSVGLIMAPAVIFYRSADYIATGLHQYSQGAHLVN